MITSRLSFAYGILLALWLYVGRTDFARLGIRGVDGPFGELRLLAVLALLGLALLAILTGTDTRWKRPDGVGLILFGALVLTVWGMTGLGATHPSVARKAWDISILTIAVITTGAIASFGSVGSLRRGVVSGIVLLSLAFCGMGILALALGRSEGRLAVLGGGPNVYARLVAFSGLWALTTISGGRTMLRAGIVGVSALCVVLSGSRGGLVAFVAGACVAIALRPTWRAASFLVGTVVALAGLLILTPVGEFAVEVFQSRVLELTVRERYSSGRSEIVLLAIDYIVRAPWLGHGLGRFEETGWVYPHNLVLEAGVEGGLPLALLVTVFLLWLMGRVWTLRDNEWGRVLAVYTSFIVVAAMFSGDVYDSRLVFILPSLALIAPPGVRASNMHAPSLPSRRLGVAR